MEQSQALQMPSGSNLFTVATYNVNSIRARMHIVIPWLKQHQPSVLCMQETKVVDADFPRAAFEEAGYFVVFRGQKSYNGVAVASRLPIQEVQYGFQDGEDTPEDQARLIACVINGVRIVNTYVPQGREITDSMFQYKLKWFERLNSLFSRWVSREPLLWCGDLNVAPEPMDVYDPDGLKNHVCFHEDVRRAFHAVKALGLVDIFRKFNQEPKQYTFYDYRFPKSVERVKGWRIDHILANESLAVRATGCYIDMEPRLAEKPSDHTVLAAVFDV
ncbi:MAG: exodeoxyribonuclease III [Deltaproteobacteria bacterium]|nr:exodeoxyribonuclease III [Deltaproteobacteria bacterium]